MDRRVTNYAWRRLRALGAVLDENMWVPWTLSPRGTGSSWRVILKKKIGKFYLMQWRFTSLTNLIL
jgi:hypothetical protein